MADEKNDPKAVSTTRGIKGGYMFVAPLGTKLPTSYDEPLDPAFRNAGYVSSDGWTESTDSETSDGVTDVNGEVVISSERTSTSETLQCKLISVTQTAMGVQYGSQNVTDSNGLLMVRHNWANATEQLECVLDLVLKDNHRWRKVVPAGSVTDLDDNTLSSTEVQGHQVTITYANDETGTGCYDYIQSYETTAADAESEG